MTISAGKPFIMAFYGIGSQLWYKCASIDKSIAVSHPTNLLSVITGDEQRYKSKHKLCPQYRGGKVGVGLSCNRLS